MTIIAYIDFKHHIISDKFNIILSFIGIVNILINFDNLKDYILTALLVFTFFFIIAIISKGGIGGGDIKLFTALSLIFGTNILFIIIITYIAAAIVSIIMMFFKKYNLKSSVALAPFIMIGTLTYLLL